MPLTMAPGTGKTCCWAPRAVIRLASVSSRGGFVLLHNTRGDAPAVAERDALVLRPRPDVAAAPTACLRTPRPAALWSSSLAGMFDVRSELLAQRRGVLLVQVDLVLRAADPEPQRLGCRTSVKIVF